MNHQEFEFVGQDQAARLRELMKRHRKCPPTLAVASGKGGVGKTNIAVNLSICLAARGLRVTLADVDMGLANADLLMDLHPRYTLSHVLDGTRTIDEICMIGPGGIRVVPGASGVHELANLTEFERQNVLNQFQRLEDSTDIIVLDCGAGVSRNVISFALAADNVLVVTTPQPTAITDAYAMIKALHRERYTGRTCLVVNMANSRADAQATHGRVAQVAKRFLNYSVANVGYLLHDTTVELAVRRRCPFVIAYPGSNASACIASVASEVARACLEKPRRGGFFRRVAGLFV